MLISLFKCEPICGNFHCICDYIANEQLLYSISLMTCMVFYGMVVYVD